MNCESEELEKGHICLGCFVDNGSESSVQDSFQECMKLVIWCAFLHFSQRGNSIIFKE